MKKITVLIILLLTTMMAGAESKSVEIEMVATAYVEPIDHGCYECGVSSSLNRMRLYSVLTYPDMRGEIYFKFNNSGKAKLELYMPCAYTDKVIKFDFNGFTKEITLPKVGSSSEYKWITIYDGQLQGKPDYSCLKVWNMTKGYIDIQKLRITADSKVIEGVSYGKTERDRLAPYLALFYSTGGEVESFYQYQRKDVLMLRIFPPLAGVGLRAGIRDWIKIGKE
jgi:hypothetical protein